MDINGVAQVRTGVESKALSKAATARGITFNRLGPKGVIKASFQAPRISRGLATGV